MDDEWSNYQKMVLWDLKRLSTELKEINHKIDSIQIDLAALKVKAGIWGVAGGLISVCFMLAVQFFVKK